MPPSMRTNLFTLNTDLHQGLNQPRYNKGARALDYLRQEFPDAEISDFAINKFMKYTNPKCLPVVHQLLESLRLLQRVIVYFNSRGWGTSLNRSIAMASEMLPISRRCRPCGFHF